MFKLRNRGLAALSVLALSLAATSTHARPPYLDAWLLKYPTSTIPTRMESTFGLACYTCHNPAGFGAPGNCYRLDVKELIDLGVSIDDALDQLDAVDSDLDGFTNGEEATMLRTDSADVGFSQGLVGANGTDPCGPDPGLALTGVSETPPGPVPTVSVWGLLVLSLLVLTAGTVLVSRRPNPTV